MKRNKKDTEELTSVLAESFHTAFRKGCDGGGSHLVWKAIRDMDNEQWASAIDWTLYCIEESGYKIVKKSR